MACDELSVAGLVDLMAADTSEGGLPDSFTSPFGFPLFVAVITRIAAYPHRFDLWPGTLSDRFACAEIAACFEQTESPIVQACEADEKETHILFAIDIVANASWASIAQNIAHRKNTARRKEVKNVLIEEQVHLEAMEALMRMGIALCFDVAGPLTPQVYNEFGYASKALDNASIARQEKAMRLGAVPSYSTFRGNRLTSRSDRQAKLLQIMHSVEDWLCTGVWNGVQLNTPNEQNLNISRRTPVSNHRVFSANPQNDDLHDKLCQSAFQKAQTELSSLLAQVPATTTHSLGLVTCIYGKHSRIQCADCPANIYPHEGFAFSGTGSFCSRCSRRRCLDCQRAPDVFDRVNCLRCMHN